ncbi:hypothetical protein ACI1MP_32125 [Kitasatospora griseola]|uniref:hypothetical protein n=1 Tax=Kitasatospora griseola TaxID=2064 RepID=UPI003855F6E5
MNDKDAELATALDEFAALLTGVADPISQDRYEQVESTRLLLGQALTADPARTARLADLHRPRRHRRFPRGPTRPRRRLPGRASTELGLSGGGR